MSIGKHINAGMAPVLPTYTIATLPAASANTGVMVFCSDCAVTSGTGNMVYSNGTIWKRADTGATATT